MCQLCAYHLQIPEKKGVDNPVISFATEELSFSLPAEADVTPVLEGINQLGYEVVLPGAEAIKQSFYKTLAFKFFFCLIFTLPLLLHMWVSWHWLHNHWVQLALSTPVYLVGMAHFGRSAFRSLRNGVANMDVLVTLGATAAYFYSLTGTLLQLGSDYLFYETAAAIITLVFLGNLLEERSVKQTTTAIAELARMQITTARKIHAENGSEHIHEIDNRELRVGDQVLVNTGDKIPMDGTIYWGSGHVNESMISGESAPVAKKEKDKVIGGTILEEGSIKLFITATGKDTVLSYIIELVKQAQGNKPPMQKLADRISAVFVPLVLGIAVLTFAGWYWIGNTPFSSAMMRSIAVLVIACPCAMGLATPAAVMVGLGRAARNGILIKGGHTLEMFRNIRQIVFDKTGTLTTGKLQLGAYKAIGMDEQQFKAIVINLEKYSSHPVAKSITAQWKGAGDYQLQQVREQKGVGMMARDKAGNEWRLGSYKMAEGLTEEKAHNIYLVKNNELAGWIDFTDELRPEAVTVVRQLKATGIKTILLSGDMASKCYHIAQQLGIDEVYAEQSPAQKLQKVEELMKVAPLAMVGDGINDAPALAKAAIGISLSDATQVAMQSANVVLLNNHLGALPLAMGLGKHTYITIKKIFSGLLRITWWPYR
ncbi:cadmium-translocating P-type ATPase [Chitinophaga sedimenti]|uniref:heavy metal translocating P-type ATPase n=1 Tax=Chitinophaga sedimenti TaxID=2033606 RepID=UPI002005DD5F|nr:cation-translocating P-type ATPase [Chitinophaga sedimenti]MCK7559200.1 cadmium-translocating P-type ATPase [Chitinophaga sedimenti]